MSDFEAMTQRWVKRAIRAEMVKRGITFGDLAQLLVLAGADENERNLRNKIARGTFSAALFVQCLAAMGCKTLAVDLLDRMYAGSDDAEIKPPSSVVIPLIRAVRDAIHLDTSEGHELPGLPEVRDAVLETDLAQYTAGTASLEETVQAVRKTLASKSLRK